MVPAGSILTYSHISSPHWRQRRKFRSDAVEITLIKQPSLASIRLRGTVLAANRKPRHNNTVTQRRYGRRAVIVSGDVRFQDGDAIDVGKLVGGALSSLFLLSFYDLLVLAYFTVSYIHRTTVICDVRHSGTFCA